VIFLHGYVFDSNTFINLFRHYYESRFPTLWANFHDLITEGRLISVREVKIELQTYYRTDRLTKWIQENDEIFKQPDDSESKFIKDIFEIERFRRIIERKKILSGKPVADPFLIAKAKILGISVVTEEKYKKNGVKIPNICEYFDIPCTNLEGFMENENWQF